MIFALRVLLLAILYLFLLAVILVTRRDVARAAHAQPAAASIALIVRRSGGTSLSPGQTLRLGSFNSLGRSPRNQIVLDDTFVSSEHAIIRLRDGAFWLEDLGSTNGTLLNERPVDRPVALEPGDVIGIGDIRLEVSV